jgi:hypothetical protein
MISPLLRPALTPPETGVVHAGYPGQQFPPVAKSPENLLGCGTVYFCAERELR